MAKDVNGHKMYTDPSVAYIEADKECLKKSGSFSSARLLGFFSIKIVGSVTAANSYHQRCGVIHVRLRQCNCILSWFPG